jgi:hypothetical protein
MYLVVRSAEGSASAAELGVLIDSTGLQRFFSPLVELAGRVSRAPLSDRGELSASQFRVNQEAERI